MNDNSSTNESQSKLLSDDQMDSLLGDFFRLEVPVELNQPLHLRPSTVTTLTVTAELEDQPTRPRSVRFVAVAASVAAMAMSVVVAISAGTSPPSHGGTIANGLRNPPTDSPDIDKPMLVSEGDSKKSTRTVGADGVTLEETDSIELHPQK